MSGAEDIGVRHRQHWLDKDVELPAADEAVIVGGVLPEVEGEVFRLLRLDNLAGGVPDLGLDAAAADGAGHGPVLAHQQLGAFIAGDGPADLDNGRERALLPQLAQAHELLVNIHYDAIITCRQPGP